MESVSTTTTTITTTTSTTPNTTTTTNTSTTSTTTAIRNSPVKETNNEAPTSDFQVAAAQVKLPTFSVVGAPIWFRRAEVQFRLKRVTNSTTKADHVLAALPDDIFPTISEWLMSKGDTAIEYDDLKQFLLERFTPSAAARVTQILQLTKQPLGDQKPSDAFREMKALARLPPATDGSPRQVDLLRALWLRRLPESIRSSIHNAEDMKEDALQQLVDGLMEARTASASHIHAASSSEEPPPEDEIEDNIAAVNHTLPRARLPPAPQYQKYQPHHFRSDFPAVGHTPPPTRRSIPRAHLPPSSIQCPPVREYHNFQARKGQGKGKFVESLCYFHSNFGPKARKCSSPCSWPKNI